MPLLPISARSASLLQRGVRVGKAQPGAASYSGAGSSLSGMRASMASMARSWSSPALMVLPMLAVSQLLRRLR